MTVGCLLYWCLHTHIHTLYILSKVMFSDHIWRDYEDYARLNNSKLISSYLNNASSVFENTGLDSFIKKLLNPFQPLLDTGSDNLSIWKSLMQSEYNLALMMVCYLTVLLLCILPKVARTTCFMTFFFPNNVAKCSVIA